MIVVPTFWSVMGENFAQEKLPILNFKLLNTTVVASGNELRIGTDKMARTWKLTPQELLPHQLTNLSPVEIWSDTKGGNGADCAYC